MPPPPPNTFHQLYNTLFNDNASITSFIVYNTFDFCTGKPTFDLVSVEFQRIPIGHSGAFNNIHHIDAATFRPTATGLDHALVACDLTQILARSRLVEAGRNITLVSRISLKRKFNFYYNFSSSHFDCWSHEQYIIFTIILEVVLFILEAMNNIFSYHG